MVVVDCPSIGESDTTDEIIAQYLLRAFTFIYVMDSTNAEEIQRDRVSADNVLSSSGVVIIYCIQ